MERDNFDTSIVGEQMAWESFTLIYWQSQKIIDRGNRKIYLSSAGGPLNESDKE